MGSADHLRGTALRDDAALGEHEDMLGEAHHRLHHMLDHQHADAAGRERPQHRNDVADFRRVEAGQHFVEQQKLRLGRERARQFEALSAGDRQRMRGPREQIAKADVAPDLLRKRDRLGTCGMAQMRADQNVVAHRKSGEWLHDLKGTGDAAAGAPMRRLAGDVEAGVADLAGARLEKARDQGKQRGLAGAVGADQRGDPAGIGRQRSGVDRQQAAEAARHAVD